MRLSAVATVFYVFVINITSSSWEKGGQSVVERICILNGSRRGSIMRQQYQCTPGQVGLKISKEKLPILAHFDILGMF